MINHLFKKLFIFSFILSSNWCISQSIRKPLAIIRSDNSFVTYVDSSSATEALPENIQEKISAIKPKSSATDSIHIFKVVFDSKVSIYIVKFENFNDIRYKFIAYNKLTGQLTNEPPEINGKWMENNEAGFNKENRLLSSPLIFFEDINQDGKKEIAVKERVHDGNVYNAVVTNYFSLESNEEFKKLISIETKQRTLDGCIISRFYQNNYIYSDITCDSSVSKLGKVQVDFKSYPFIKSRVTYKQEYNNLLITGSGLKENNFLKNGYIYSY